MEEVLNVKLSPLDKLTSPQYVLINSDNRISKRSMKINENQKILASKTILVPYEAVHVPKYHKWMEDEEILRLTGSERLTLDEEYEMQKSWRNDEDKLTFIILSKDSFADTNEEISSMVGDVNLFINWEENTAEVEVMIAEPSARKKGIATEAVSLIITYAVTKLKIANFFAKITEDNTASLNMFTKKLGFRKVSYSSVFMEHTIELQEDELHRFSNFSNFDAVLTIYK